MAEVQNRYYAAGNLLFVLGASWFDVCAKFCGWQFAFRHSRVIVCRSASEEAGIGNKGTEALEEGVPEREMSIKQ